MYIKALFPMILHKGVKASGMYITIKALYKLGQMITSFLHEVFVEITESETTTTTAVKVYIRDDDYNSTLSVLTTPQGKG